MPTISMFFGISIRMFYDDHAPPHFHAIYGKQAAVIEIETLLVQKGRMSRRALALVLEWASNHQTELLENWRLAEKHSKLKQIAPLD